MKRMWNKRLICFLTICFVMVLFGGGIALFELSQTEPLPEEIPQINPIKYTAEGERIKETEPILQEEPVEEKMIDEEELLITLTMDMLARQEQIEREIEAEFEQGEYTFQNPLVVLDPYGVSPLTAILMFRTEERCQISIKIPGGGEKSIDDVSFTFEGYEVEHRIPVYGMLAGQVNQIYLTAEKYSGGKIENIIEITTAKAIDAICSRSNKYRLWDESAYQPGLNFANEINVGDEGRFAFDSEGNCRWYITGRTEGTILEHLTHSVEFTQDGYCYMGCGAYATGKPVVFLKMDYLGKILGAYYVANCLHHEITETDNNTLIALGANPEVVGSEQCVAYELDLKTGEILHQLDYNNVLMRTRAPDLYADNLATDWAHLNSVVPYGEDRIIVSSNNQSTIVCNDWEGKISWMLCNPEEYPEIYSDYILKPIGDNFEYTYGQHCVTLINEEQIEKGIIDILVFDNGRCRYEHKGEIEKNGGIEGEGYSRMVVFRINEVDMTVEQIWSYGEDRTELHSPWRSSAELLENGNYLGLFATSNHSGGLYPEGYIVKEHPAYVEVDASGNLVWELHQEYGNYLQVYRVERLPIYCEGVENSHWGESTVNLIPEEILKKYGYKAADMPPDVVLDTQNGDEPTSQEKAYQSTENTADILWQFTLNDYETHSELHSVEQVPQYIGDPVEVAHDDYSVTGMQFLLLDLTISKQGPGNIPFSWENLGLSVDGKMYTRMEDDSFIGYHSYNRLPSTDLQMGSKTGWICMEIPSDIDLNNAELTYNSGSKIQSTPLN
ncbi:MAG: aryl-sulfate sulfotransferase [Lachnospiraceae bacterium]|nr:aryl-sulfate sulfotransferase [Lachnospiraceae bacterium]